MRSNIRQDVVLTSRHMSSAACVCCSVLVVCIRRTSITIIFNKIMIYYCVIIRRKIISDIWIASLLPWIPSAPLIIYIIYILNLGYKITNKREYSKFVRYWDGSFDKMHHCNTDQKQWCHFIYTKGKYCIITAADNIQSIIILSPYRPNLRTDRIRCRKTQNIPWRKSFHTWFCINREAQIYRTIFHIEVCLYDIKSLSTFSSLAFRHA